MSYVDPILARESTKNLSKEQIRDALITARLEKDKPSVIVADTIKGKGVSFMEDDNNWYYRTPNKEELTAALQEINGLQS